MTVHKTGCLAGEMRSFYTAVPASSQWESSNSNNWSTARFTPTALRNTNHSMEGTGLKLNIWAKGNPEAQVPLGSFSCGVIDSQGSRATPSPKYAVYP